MRSGDGEKSDFVTVLSGVPEGSVMGPVLFLAYINDLPQNIRSRVRLFADDTILYLTITSEDRCRQFQDDLDALKTLGGWSLTTLSVKCCGSRGLKAHSNILITCMALH